jgi:hypothetical protein
MKIAESMKDRNLISPPIYCVPTQFQQKNRSRTDKRELEAPFFHLAQRMPDFPFAVQCQLGSCAADKGTDWYSSGLLMQRDVTGTKAVCATVANFVTVNPKT